MLPTSISHFRPRNRAFALALWIATLVLSGCAATAYPSLANVNVASESAPTLPAPQQPETQPETQVVQVDIVDIPHLFVIDEAPVYEDGAPAHGNTFITQGYIYPHGTLNGSNGVLPNGEPEFPDKVLGTWYCRGWFIGDAGHAEAGPIAFTTQFFDFDEEYGGATLVTEGYESMDINQPFARAITGGTGEFMNARGQAMQELLGFNEQMAVNLRMEIRLTR